MPTGVVLKISYSFLHVRNSCGSLQKDNVCTKNTMVSQKELRVVKYLVKYNAQLVEILHGYRTVLLTHTG